MRRRFTAIVHIPTLPLQMYHNLQLPTPSTFCISIVALISSSLYVVFVLIEIATVDAPPLHCMASHELSSDALRPAHRVLPNKVPPPLNPSHSRCIKFPQAPKKLPITTHQPLPTKIPIRVITHAFKLESTVIPPRHRHEIAQHHLRRHL